MITNIAHLDADQQAALRVHDRSLLLTGCAGSGKSTIMAHRIKQAVEALQEGAGPVLALTPTKHAVTELQRQVQALIRDAHQRVRISSLAGFYDSLLREHGAAIGLRPDFDADAPVYSRREALRTVVTSVHGHDVPISDTELGMIEEVLLAGPKAYRKEGDDLDWLRGLREERTRLLHAYTAKQWALNQLDPIGLQWSVRQLLTKVPAIAAELRSRYPRLFLDDLHHASCDVVEVLRAWAGDQGMRVDMALDDDQAPFTYLALTASWLEPLIASLNMRQRNLSANYRSPGPVVEAGNQLLRHRYERLPTKPLMRAMRPATGAPVLRVRHFASVDEELPWVISDIARRPVSEHGRCAIIVPEGHLYFSIEDTLIRANGPIRIPGSPRTLPDLNEVEVLRPEMALGRVFAHVYIVALAEGIWPPWARVPIDGMNHEVDADRRVLFAQMMAAQASLTLTSACQYGPMSTAPSRFLYEMEVLEAQVAAPYRTAGSDGR
jgi:superfamily I DNA/RNA helicase